MIKLPRMLGQLLCWFGYHDFRVISKEFDFGTKGVEKDECRRCGFTVTHVIY